MSHVDWLSHILQMITITGRVDVRCIYGAPWRVAWPQSVIHEVPYHIVLNGRAIIEDPETHTARELVAGDIVLLPHGSAHVLHDGSGHAPGPTCERHGSAGLTLSENGDHGERLDMLCGRFLIGRPHERLIRNYLPNNVVIRTFPHPDESDAKSAPRHLASLIGLMREDSTGDKVGRYTILNALSSALFTLVLREAIGFDSPPAGLLALAGHPRLAPAISAMFADPARPWNLPELAALCSMSRATFMRHFQDTLGRSAIELLSDIRMSLAANDPRRLHLNLQDGSPAA
ncbi:AraC family transcriptional regulator [Paraburkholderia caledonica]|uniref:AraC family transcriptional regulator n=1 Tax=Paraburkholderia caledonica TaxID=134536 RepID=UPI0038B93742